jgi:hypothetical protein
MLQLVTSAPYFVLQLRFAAMLDEYTICVSSRAFTLLVSG